MRSPAWMQPRSLRRAAVLLLVLSLTACHGFFQDAKLQSISVSPSNPSVVTGSTQQFSAVGLNDDGSTNNHIGSVTWSSSNSSVATISSTGLATAVGAGTTTITATAGTLTGSTTLTVTKSALTSIQITDQNGGTVRVGATDQFKATGTFQDGSTSDITSSVTWTATNGTGSASFSSTTAGLLTGNTAGTVTVTAQSGNISSQTTVTVSVF
jgi:hypothetical protein